MAIKKVLLLLWSISGLSFGVHNLKLNGEKLATITHGDTLHLTFEFESAGSTALYKVYVDANRSGAIDATDPLLSWGKFYDGSFLDEDEAQNGSYHQIYKETGEFPNTQLILKAEDNGIADSVVLNVQPLSSGYSVYGKVTGIPDPSNILIFTEYTSGETGRRYTYRAITDSLGEYRIYIPDSLGNRSWKVICGDFLVRAPGYLAPLSLGSIFIDGHVRKNFPFFPSDGVTISGKVKGDNGLSLPDSLTVWGGGGTLVSLGVATAYTTSGTGFYNLKIKGNTASEWHIQPLLDPLFPEYLTPPELVLTITGNKTQDLSCYKADTTITGHIYKDGGFADGIRVQAEDTVLTGKTWTGSFSDGHYELRVSSKADNYRIRLNPNDIPSGYGVQEGFQWAKPGDQGVDFHLISTGIIQLPNLDRSPTRSLEIAPNPAKDFLNAKFFLSKAGPTSLKVYDTFGRLVMAQFNHWLEAGYHHSHFPLRGLANGVYFVELDHSGSRATKKLLILREPKL